MSEETRTQAGLARIIDPNERERAHSGDTYVDFYAEALEQSAKFREEYKDRVNVVKWQDMPFEKSPDGLIRHIVNEKMDTMECCIDVYMQLLPPGGATGKSRHMSEEIAYVVEGRGYDLHWDVRFDCEDEFSWEWAEEPKRFEWSTGDFVYIPPYCAHKRFNGDPDNEARVIVVNSRIIKAIGFDWFEQLENAEGS
jgi:uncharacterized RmlC-like cupin family protein